MSHQFSIRVYYEDTDLGGVVYYANYLKFIERARTEMLSDGGVDQAQLLSDTGIAFVVRRVEADYLRPARFEDRLVVETVVDHATGSRILLTQTVRRGDEVLFVAKVVLVCVDLATVRPTRLPETVQIALGHAHA